MKGNLWRLKLFRALYWTHFVAAVLVPFFTDWGGLDLTQIMLLNAWFMLWGFLLEIPTGAVADFFGRKWSIVLGAAVTSAACLLYVSTRRYEVFLVSEMIFALGYTLVSGADEALAYDSLVATGETSEASRHLAQLQSAQLVGLVAGALGGGVIAGAWGVRAPLGCQAIPIAMAGLVALSLVEPTTSAAKMRTVPYPTLLLAGVRHLRRDARFRVVALDAVLVSALVWTLIWLYQPLLERAGVSRAYFGPMHAALCLVQIGVLSVVERMIPLVGGRARYLRTTAAMAGIAMLVLAPPARPGVVAAALLVAMGVGLSRMPVAAAALNAGVESHARATTLSTVSMLRTLAICVVNPIAGWLADGSLGRALGTLGGATLLVALLSPLRERHLRA